MGADLRKRFRVAAPTYHPLAIALNWITTPGSSSIVGFGYDARRMVLTIEFKATRARYQYFEVPEPVFQEMRRAESKGRYFADHVRGLFRYARL